MIDINEIKGKNVKYVGERSQYFTYGERYRIGVANDKMFTVDNDGDDHEVDAEYLERAFDVAAYIKKPSMVGKYVRYIVDGSDFIRKDDIGIVIKEHKGGDFDVRWLNPIQAHTEHVPAWFASKCHVEVIG